MEKLLIIEDNEEIRTQLKWGFKKDYDILLGRNAMEGIRLFKKHMPKVVTLDLGLPPFEGGTSEGFRCFEEILGISPFTKIIVITGNDDIENAIRSVHLGAYDYYKKPIDLAELKVIIKRALHLYRIEEENRRLRAELEKTATEFVGMVGQSPQMQEIFSVIRKVASTDVPVLIEGESGTGKELVARAIHHMSLRKHGPFIPINCGAIPESLLESELFGHEKGAFTGAHSLTRGKVEYADGGTLFLDEIGELSSLLQVKLLRFLQEKKFQRVGGREDIHVDTRIISATNIDISRALEDGTFREDLFYRIGVIRIKLPLLRERGEDIMLLANLFLTRFSNELRKKIKGFSRAAIEMMRLYSWPGNVRELENRIQRAVLMAESSLIEPEDLDLTEKLINGERMVYYKGLTLKEARENIEKNMIYHTLVEHKGNIAQASEALGISRPTLYDLIRKYNIRLRE